METDQLAGKERTPFTKIKKVHFFKYILNGPLSRQISTSSKMCREVIFNTVKSENAIINKSMNYKQVSLSYLIKSIAK